MSKTKSKKIPIRLLNDRVLIRRDESLPTTAGGIVLPESAKEQPARGEIVYIGPGRLSADGTRAPMYVGVTDRVLFPKYAGNEVEVGGEKLLLLVEEDVLAIIEEGDDDDE